MKKILLVFIFYIFLLNNAFAKNVILECKFPSGKDFGTPFIVTLKDVFRQNIITRGQDISEDDTLNIL